MSSLHLRDHSNKNILELKGGGGSRTSLTVGITALAFTRRGRFIRCFAICGDLYEYLERKKELSQNLKCQR